MLVSEIQTLKAGVEAVLAEYFRAKRASAGTLAQEAIELVDAVETLTMRGGKRLRALVVRAGMLAIDPKAEVEPALQAGAAIELLQTYLLIHDDWMDQDDQRRGGPAIHRLLAETRQNEHLGASLAVLAGDLAGTYAWELLSTAAPAQHLLAVVRNYVRMQEEVLFGQHLDVTASLDIERMHALKTASYTVTGPLRIGAALCGGKEDQMQALCDFGTPIGIAFQLRDDLLGTFGQAAETGKPTGNDLRAGKRNALTVEAERRLGPDWAKVSPVFGRKNAAQDDVEVAIAAIRSSGAAQAVETELARLTSLARARLAAAPFSEEGKSMLEGIVRLLVDRDR